MKNVWPWLFGAAALGGGVFAAIRIRAALGRGDKVYRHQLPWTSKEQVDALVKRLADPRFANDISASAACISPIAVYLGYEIVQNDKQQYALVLQYKFRGNVLPDYAACLARAL